MMQIAKRPIAIDGAFGRTVQKRAKQIRGKATPSGVKLPALPCGIANRHVAI
jgi:hypothetical protein